VQRVMESAINLASKRASIEVAIVYFITTTKMRFAVVTRMSDHCLHQITTSTSFRRWFY